MSVVLCYNEYVLVINYRADSGHLSGSRYNKDILFFLRMRLSPPFCYVTQNGVYRPYISPLGCYNHFQLVHRSGQYVICPEVSDILSVSPFAVVTVPVNTTLYVP